ncbi:hypothetical protein [Leptolyngbya sp. CCY15150]|uniref:hypothetical protein n=1 Tax=Leptolyngbya sp. CCY15150 TaxID=2767772 RepID=UPI00195050EE|nr:hypothetical protein [Leptolyngbya sp. CCY15150]
MKQLKEQAAKVGQTIASAETIHAYRQAIAVTWIIIKETAILLWLTLCLVLVFGDWLYTTAISAGRGARQWFNSLQKTESDQIASETGKALLAVGQSSVSSVIAQARTQLGLPEKPPVQDKTPASSPAAQTTANPTTSSVPPSPSPDPNSTPTS